MPEEDGSGELAAQVSSLLRRGHRATLYDSTEQDAGTAEALADLQKMLAFVGDEADPPYVQGQICTSTREAVRAFHEAQKYEPATNVLFDARAWEHLEQEVRNKGRRLEEKRQKRFEASRKAKFEREERLRTQKQQSEDSLSTLLNRTILDLAPAPNTKE
jgi:hypothetical protein